MKKIFLLMMMSSLVAIVRADTTTFYFVTGSYNNAEYVGKNLDSVRRQRYDSSKWHLVYVNDASKDGTGDLVEAYIHEHGLEDNITLINNEQNRGALGNIYYAVHEYCPDDAVVILLDGDDWLVGDDVLKTLDAAYANPNVWMTWGSLVQLHNGKRGPWGKPFHPKVIKARSFRSASWVTSHLRTFKSWLFKLIDQEDLMHEGAFYPMAWDLALMFPMLEMAGGRFTFIPKILYCYNDENPLNDFRKDHDLQLALEREIRNKPKYPLLERAG